MSTVRAYPWLRHYLGSSTDFVVHLDRGRLRHHGVGQAFWFRPRTSVISEVPAADQELPVLFHATTHDQQDVTVQANVTFRFADPVLASQRLDFGVFPATLGADHRAVAPSGRQQISVIVEQTAQSIAVDAVAALDLSAALASGIAQVREALIHGLRGEPRLSATGVEVIGVRVLALRPESDIERALQTPVRERLQAEADRATYERRALAVERERAISQNELASQIELATRRQELLAQEGANKQRAAREDAAAALIEAEAKATRRGLDATARASELRELGQATAASEAATLEVYARIGREVITAVALREAAGGLPKIGTLAITPDLLTSALGSFQGSLQDSAHSSQQATGTADRSASNRPGPDRR